MAQGRISAAAHPGLKGGGAVVNRTGPGSQFSIPDEKILGKLQDLVENCSLQGVSRKDLRCWLEGHFQVPLFHRRDLIKNAVDEYLDNVKRDIGVDGLLKISHTLPTLQQFESLDVRKLLGWKKPHGMGHGLRNLKNSCFMNAVLQSLLYASPLFNYLQKWRPERRSRQFCPIRELQKLSVEIHRKDHGRTNRKQQVSPNSIYQHLEDISDKLQPGRQEDAHEFLEFLLDSLHKTAMKHNGSGRQEPAQKRQATGSSFVYSMFGSCVRSQVVCKRCQHVSNSYQTQLTLSLEVTSHVSEALHKYTELERLTRDNRYNCHKCKSRVEATKRLTLFSSPPILVLHLKRFSSEYSHFGYTKKIHDHIHFPERMCLQDYMSDNSCAPGYSLHAVVVHTGYSGNNGHYVCYVRDSNEDWYHVDDHFVMKVATKKVLQQQAYILFYTLNSSLRATRPISKHFNIQSILRKYHDNCRRKQAKAEQKHRREREKASSRSRQESSTHRVSGSHSQSRDWMSSRPRSKSTQTVADRAPGSAGISRPNEWEMGNFSSLDSSAQSSAAFSNKTGLRGVRSAASNAGRTRSTGRRRDRRRDDNRWSGGSVASTRSNDWLLHDKRGGSEL